MSSQLHEKDGHLVRLYVTACQCRWEELPGIASAFRSVGGSVEELRGCLRHLIILAGYGPCLAATLTLQKASVLPYHTPGKVDGPPGDAFRLVYSTIAPVVGRRVHDADPVLAEWIRLHAYGDIYSSPGISMKCKQLLTCARLAQANMEQQLFGHVIAAMRFGLSRDQLEEAIGIAFEVSPCEVLHKKALKTIDMAVSKFTRDVENGKQVVLKESEVFVEDPSCICVPEVLLGQRANSSCDVGDEIVRNCVHRMQRDTVNDDHAIEDDGEKAVVRAEDGAKSAGIKELCCGGAAPMADTEGKKSGVYPHKFAWEILNENMPK